jgi:hypothetical protein
LAKDDRRLGSGLHPQWKALLVSEPRDGKPDVPPAAIIDLEKEAFDWDGRPYRNVMQSFMLLDRDGRIRVRQTDSLASRTVLAQDRGGRILVVFVPGACTLYELAQLLKSADLDIEQAMSLDGGFEAQLSIGQGDARSALYGSWVVNDRRQVHIESLKVPLPTVVAVIPR